MLSENDFDGIDRSVDSLESRIRQLEAENAGLKDQIRSLKDENETMKERFSYWHGRLETVIQKMSIAVTSES